MAEEMVISGVTFKWDDTKNKVDELKQKLKEAQSEFAKTENEFGFWNKQTQEAFVNMVDLENRVKTGTGLLKMFAVTGAEMWEGLNTGLNGLKGGFSSLNGLLELFGEHSEVVESALEKVNTVLEFNEKLEGIKKAGEAFKNFGSVLKDVAKTGFGSIKAAIIETGIGALVIVLTLLISKLWDWISGSAAGKEAQEKLKSSIDKTNETLKDHQTELSNAERLAVSRAKATGASEQQIFQIQQDYARKNTALIQKAISEKEEQIKKFEQFRNRDKESEKAYQEALADLKKNKQDLDKANLDYEVKENERKAQLLEEDRAKQKQVAEEAKQREQDRKERQRQADEDAKKREEEKKNRDMQAADDELETERNKNKNKQALGEAEAKQKGKTEDDIFKIQQDARQRDIDDLNIYAEKLKIIYGENSKEYKKALRDIVDAQTIFNVAAVNEQISVANHWKAIIQQIKDEQAKRAQKEKESEDLITAAEDKARDEKKKKHDDAVIEITDMQKAGYATQFDTLEKWHEKTLNAIGEDTKAKEKLDKIYAQKKMDIEISLASNLLGQAADLFGKQTVAGKTFAIAQATIDTYKAANAAYAAMAGIPVVGPALGVVAAGMAVASGIKSIKAIVATKVAGTSDSTSAPSINGASIGAPAPLTPQIQQSNTQLNQNQLNQIGNATVRAFVLESDVSNNQEKIARLNRAARLGG